MNIKYTHLVYILRTEIETKKLIKQKINIFIFYNV